MNQCSYNLLNNNLSYPSPCRYECHTCWGKNSVYRCCTYCVKNCYSNHEHSVHNVPYKDTSKAFTCDCGKSKHKSPYYTRTPIHTGNENVKQPFYECYDCFKNPSEEVCCLTCANKCHMHAKHNVAKVMFITTRVILSLWIRLLQITMSNLYLHVIAKTVATIIISEQL